MKIHVDSDCGVDDAIAIRVLASGSGGAGELVSATACWGNVHAGVAARNIAATAGADLPEVVWERNPPRGWRSAYVHGVDGLGGQARIARARAGRVEGRPGDAGLAIVEFARRTQEAGTLLCIGPLTNLARALQIDASAVESLGRVVALGGFGLNGGKPGLRGLRDSNVVSDLSAAKQVENLSIDWVGLDVTRAFRLSAVDLPSGWFEIGRAYGCTRRVPGKRWSMPCHDLLAAVAVLDAEAFVWDPVKPEVGGSGVTFRSSTTGTGRVATGADFDVVREHLRSALWS